MVDKKQDSRISPGIGPVTTEIPVIPGDPTADDIIERLTGHDSSPRSRPIPTFRNGYAQALCDVAVELGLNWDPVGQVVLITCMTTTEVRIITIGQNRCRL